MSNIATISRSTAAPAIVAGSFQAKELLLIRQTVAKDTNDQEFDLFISYCRALKLDPRRRQIYAFVYSKDKPDKRKMSIIVAIDGLRTIADRTGCYRPDEDEPRYEMDAAAKSSGNPIGIVKATVTVHKYAHGQWHPVTASAYWDEYAPVKDGWSETIEKQAGTWPDGNPKMKTIAAPGAVKVQTLDTSGQWGKMPRLMLAKCAEALALRKAWPDDFSGVYVEEEMDRARVLDMTPSEAAEAGAIESRLALVGAANGLMIQWQDNSPIESVPLGQMADRCMAFFKENAEETSAIMIWADRNRVALQEFWARAKGDALAVKDAMQQALTRADG